MLHKFLICTLFVFLIMGYGQIERGIIATSSVTIPKLLNYQGYLTDESGNPITDTLGLDMTIEIFDAETGGNELWSEDTTDVPVEQGIFHIILGSVNPIPDDVFTQGTARWLQLTVEGESLDRTRITSVAYSYVAAYADTAEYAKTGVADNDWIISEDDMYSGVPGNVGIGTSYPSKKLEVYSGGDAVMRLHAEGIVSTNVDLIARSTDTPNGFPHFLINTNDVTRFVISSHGNVGIGTLNPNSRLAIKAGTDGKVLEGMNELGQVIVEIGEGSDYAETFPFSQEEISPGVVVVIDTRNVGELTVSTEAYDTKVAGVVSGAKGLGSGVKLGAEKANGHAVALAGRVYCNVDTKYGDIEPGDLLTTSPTPGHAMVVKDFSRAQGAILGKAMEEISGGGKGQILTLVTLQ